VGLAREACGECKAPRSNPSTAKPKVGLGRFGVTPAYRRDTEPSIACVPGTWARAREGRRDVPSVSPPFANDK
jgi:hypothetical protein